MSDYDSWKLSYDPSWDGENCEHDCNGCDGTGLEIHATAPCEDCHGDGFVSCDGECYLAEDY